MKKIIIFSMLLILSAASFSQQTKPAPALTKQDYLKKSEGQNSTAWVLLSVGTAVLAGTMISAATSVCISCPKKSFPVVLVGLGGTAVVSSIPFFIASSRNKKKAMSLSFKNETAPQLQKDGFTNRPVPSLALKINL